MQFLIKHEPLVKHELEENIGCWQTAMSYSNYAALRAAMDIDNEAAVLLDPIPAHYDVAHP